VNSSTSIGPPWSSLSLHVGNTSRAMTESRRLRLHVIRADLCGSKFDTLFGPRRIETIAGSEEWRELPSNIPAICSHCRVVKYALFGLLIESLNEQS